jgi:gamma-glutamylcyclotransferase (GGCT)/AIG2-like uncharacterized protein YtfP
MIYFAYGSNLDPAQWQGRCPGSPFVAVARLDGYRIAFPRRSPVRGCAVASIVPDAGGIVWGALYRMDAADLAALDRREACFPDRPAESRYLRAPVSVTHAGGAAVDAFTYVAVPSPEPGLPSATYLRHLIDGASHHRLPEDYVAMLTAIPTLVEA